MRTQSFTIERRPIVGQAMRKGRPRKTNVEREANGRVKRVYENPRLQVSEQPHRIVVPVRFRELPEAESEFGRLMLMSLITPAQYEAGKMYAELAARYRAALMCRPITPSGIDLERVGCGKTEGMADGTARSIKRAYDSAFESCEPHKLQKVIAHHAVHDIRVPDPFTRDLLKTGLDKLVKHFGIDKNLQITSGQK